MNRPTVPGPAPLTAVLIAVAALVCALFVPTTSGAFLTAITNGTNTAATGIFTCTRAAQAFGASAYFIWPLSETTSVQAAADVSTNGTRTGAYQNVTGVATGAAGPCPRDGARAVTLSNTLGTGGGYVSMAATATTVTNPTVFSAGVWFKTTTTTGGKLIGFGNARTGSSGNYDRHIYMTNTGVLYAGVYPGAVKTVDTGTTKYNDGVWHFAMMTLSSAGLCLYVDATSKCDSTVTSAENTTGYWRVGYDNLASWTNSPTSYFFTGSLAFAQVYTTALSASQVSTLYSAGK